MRDAISDAHVGGRGARASAARERGADCADGGGALARGRVGAIHASPNARDFEAQVELGDWWRAVHGRHLVQGLRDRDAIEELVVLGRWRGALADDGRVRRGAPAREFGHDLPRVRAQRRERADGRLAHAQLHGRPLLVFVAAIPKYAHARAHRRRGAGDERRAGVDRQRPGEVVVAARREEPQPPQRDAFGRE